jgi:hypothetical protein
VPYYRKKDEYVISHLPHPTQAHLKWAFSLLPFSHKVGHSIKKPNCRLMSAIASSAIIYYVKNVRYTTSIQQLYNNLSHEGGSHILGPTLM